MSITVTAEIKDRFFDRQRVVEQLGRENARRLSRMGAFVRRRAMTDILRRGPARRKRGLRAVSRPGSPPYVWSRNSFASLRNILFGLSWDNNSVVIGPRLVPSLMLKASSARTVPELLTKGGTARVAQWSNDGDVWQLGHSAQAAYHRTIDARYSPHPFMGPALQKEVDAGVVTNVWSVSAG